MIDRLVHHAEILALKGDSFRLKDKDSGLAAAQGLKRERPPAPLRPTGLRYAGAQPSTERGDYSTGERG